MTIDWGSGWGWGMGLWMLGGLALTVGMVVLIVWVVVSVSGRPDRVHRGPQQTPLDILRERYARGEISAEEFEQARRILGY
jgi:putative membrane protein